MAWLRLTIENSNNIRLKKSTLDTLLLRTYKQTEFLCTHINKHSPGDDDGACFHLRTASIGVVAIGGSPLFCPSGAGKVKERMCRVS